MVGHVRKNGRPGSRLGLVVGALVPVDADVPWDPVKSKGGGREGGADLLELLADAKPLGLAWSWLGRAGVPNSGLVVDEEVSYGLRDSSSFPTLRCAEGGPLCHLNSRGVILPI